MSSDPSQHGVPPEQQPTPGLRFGVGTLLFIFTLFILMAAACGGLVRMKSVSASDAKMMIYALPLGGMIGASLIRGLAIWLDKHSK